MRLRDQGIDVLAVEEEHPGLSDEEVLALAVHEQRWVVTFDRDYGELVFAKGLPPPPVILLLREAHYRPPEPAEWVLDLLRKREQFAGHFVVFSRQALRMRPMFRVLRAT